MPDRIEQFYEARRKKGYTYRKLAKAVGVSYEAISAYEHGKYPPREDVWEKIKECLGFTGGVEEIWGRPSHNGRGKKYNEGDKCCMDGCNAPPVSKGMCRQHYSRLRYQHDKIIKKQAREGNS